MATKQLACALVIAALAFFSVRGWQISDKGRIRVLDSDFDNQVNDGHVYFVKFFAPWCGRCKALGAVWKVLAEHYKEHDTIRIAQVDCTVDRSICDTAGVSAYPTLKVFYKSEAVREYIGDRSLENLKSFVDETSTEVFSETAE